MGEPIKAGDMVMVVRSHCDKSITSGRIYVVDFVLTDATVCSGCGDVSVEPLAAGPREPGRAWQRMGIPLRYLKRIDPLSEPEHVETGEEIGA